MLFRDLHLGDCHCFARGETQMKARSIWPVGLLVGFLGCGGGVDQQSGGLGASSTLDQSITRISPAEYATAVNDLFGIPPSGQPVAVSDSTANGSALATGSADEAALADYDTAFAVATMATSAAHMSTLLKGANCAAPDGNSGSAGAACAAAFISAVAPLAFRSGPVDAPTLAGLNGLYTAVAVTQGAGFSGGMAAVVEEVLQSPYFLYRGFSS
jgi:hypothetical protein